MVTIISKRKLESYKRAEKVAQEVRRQIANLECADPNRLCDFVLHWMRVTGAIKYRVPTIKK